MNSPFLISLSHTIAEMAGGDDRPLVVYAAAWPFLREMKAADEAAVEGLVDSILKGAGGRTVLMPTFTDGFTDGVRDLDQTVSKTGLISEAFRKRPDARRTMSAFFSFAVAGPESADVSSLAPEDAWGDGSLYEWMDSRNARALMLGTHPTHASFLHRAEWLARDVVTYRFRKSFAGQVLREGETRELRETLFVRCEDPEAVNDFTPVLPLLDCADYRSATFNGITISSYDARPIISAVHDALRADPLFVVQNRFAFTQS